MAVPAKKAFTSSDEAYNFALRQRLGLHVATVGDCCAVYNQTTHTSCGHPLTPHADHAPGCARAARNAGHNHVRDWWAGVVNEAGGRALTEQWVVEYAPWKHIRSDVRAVSAPGEGVTYFDVVVAHPFTTGVPTGSVGELHTQRVSADAAVAQWTLMLPQMLGLPLGAFHTTS